VREKRAWSPGQNWGSHSIRGDGGGQVPINRGRDGSTEGKIQVIRIRTSSARIKHVIGEVLRARRLRYGHVGSRWLDGGWGNKSHP
jgi:hypothetical protein